MISFIVCLLLLITGYLTYGKIVDKTFGPDDRETPAVRINDGVDYVVMPQWKLFLVQLLNIAGLGRSSVPCRAPLGTGCIPVDHIRHHFCRRRTRLLLRHDQ